MSVRDIVQAAAGQGGDKLFVEDVMSTYLYTGNGSTQTITNGIDLAGEGGLVWIKSRSASTDHFLFDTGRGVLNEINSNRTSAQASLANSLTSFNANGFSVGSAAGINVNAATYASWTFRKAPKFFDVVTYTGNSVAGRQIPHNLGSVPGMIIVKSVSGSTGWYVYHRANTGSPATDYLRLDLTDATADSNVFWNDTNPTDTVFTVGSSSGVNNNNTTYVAYLFAHDAGGFGDTGDESVVACGSISNNNTVNLGWEPQLVLLKRTDNTGDWIIADTMRGLPGTLDAQAFFLRPHSANAENSTSGVLQITPTGFGIFNATGTFIYLAIRRPMKTPESGTEVFSAETYTGDNQTSRTFTSSINKPIDMLLAKTRSSTSNNLGGVYMVDRLRGDQVLRPWLTNAEATAASDIKFDVMNGYSNNNPVDNYYWNLADNDNVNWFFRRAPGFFDVVCYTGTGVARTVPHNLTVAPEMVIIKVRSTINNWPTYHIGMGIDFWINLNETTAKASDTFLRWVWNNTVPTSTNFTVGQGVNVNAIGETYVAYLFASLPGISKVGSYTGTGTTQQINCGFTTGARFVLIKRTDSTGDWYVWDTARGIVTGNDPYLLLNSTAAEVTNTDYIDPYSAGFEISSTAPAAINASGGSFIYYAVA